MGMPLFASVLIVAALAGFFVRPQAGRAETTAETVAKTKKEIVAETQADLIALGDAYLAQSPPVRVREAIAAYENAAGLGSTTAMMRLGALYRDGGPVAADPVRAFNYFRQAAEAGEPYGQLRVGEMTARGIGVDQDVERGRALVRELADAGNEDARVTLGDLYARGDAGPVDAGAAIAAYEQAAEAGNVTGMMRLGNLYREGALAVEDQAKALGYFRRAAEAGDLYAKLRLGEMTARGIGVEQDVDLGRRLVGEVAASGNADALVTLGDLNLRGDAGPIDGKAAAEAYEKAAAMGNSRALMRLGNLYRDGTATAPDGARAIDYFRQAAEAGENYALLALGRGYVRGQFAGVDSPEEGLPYLVEADRRGVPEAALALSEAYLNGKGVTANPARALEILADAAEQGNSLAARRLVAYYRDGSGPAARRDIQRARALLRDHADDLDPESLSYETVLLDAASAISIDSYQKVYEQARQLPPDSRRSAVRAFRRVNPNVYVFALQSRLADLGAYSGVKSGVLNAEAARALARYCRLQGSAERCREGPLSANAAEVLIQAF